mmetsp:Transcript_24106/g.45072  ORF Transcript_24106/g.45072 Transcript_24106/m.45072 type:complete len:335 (-) Transcript_24106:310-1314(-)
MDPFKFKQGRAELEDGCTSKIIDDQLKNSGLPQKVRDRIAEATKHVVTTDLFDNVSAEFLLSNTFEYKGFRYVFYDDGADFEDIPSTDSSSRAAVNLARNPGNISKNSRCRGSSSSKKDGALHPRVNETLKWKGKWETKYPPPQTTQRLVFPAKTCSIKDAASPLDGTGVRTAITCASPILRLESTKKGDQPIMSTENLRGLEASLYNDRRYPRRRKREVKKGNLELTENRRKGRLGISCINCSVRKVKCDDSPTCTNCANRGVPCIRRNVKKRKKRSESVKDEELRKLVEWKMDQTCYKNPLCTRRVNHPGWCKIPEKSGRNRKINNQRNDKK